MTNLDATDTELPEDQIDPAATALEAIQSKIDAFDFERAIQLMNVLEKCATTGVKNTPIAGLAGLALNEMNDEAKVLRAEYQAAFAEAEAERQRLIVERQQREAEEVTAVDETAPADVAETRRAPRVIPSTPNDGRRL